MKYLNQLEYAHIPYRTNTRDDSVPEEEKNSTVALSGCGLCCVAMTVELLTDKELSLTECVRLAEESGASHAVGTDMNVFGPIIAEKFDLEFIPNKDLEAAVAHLRDGGVIIGYMGVPEGCDVGLFTESGHYVCVISTDGEEFCFLDPSYSPEKFLHPKRIGRVKTSHAPYLYCDIKTFDSETRPNRVKYFMFRRKK